MRRLLAKYRPSPVFLILLIASFGIVGGVAYAATGGSLILGRANVASGGTSLRSRGGPTLKLTNTGRGLAASFNVLSTTAPFAVNSRVTVKNLSAALLDGLSSAAFQRTITGTCPAGSAIQLISPGGTVTCINALSQTWNFTGNAGTTPGANFLGTTDQQPLIVKTNGAEALRVQANGSVGINDQAPDARLQVQSTGGQQAIVASSGTGAAIIGTSAGATGMIGVANAGNGVNGQSNTGNGLVGTSTGADGAVGNSISGNGVGGTSSTGTGVVGRSGFDGVLGVSSHASGGSRAAGVEAVNTGGGDIFVGVNFTGSQVARIDGGGKGFFDGGTQTGGADYAEAMRTSVATKALAPGDVLAIDPRHGNEVTASSVPYSPSVVGVYSTKPSVLAVGDRSIDDLAGTVPVAMLGVVPTNVSAENGSVRAGDLLTTSRTPGYAMKARAVRVDGVELYPTGAILGKALEALRGNRGVIDVLVTVR